MNAFEHAILKVPNPEYTSLLWGAKPLHARLIDDDKGKTRIHYPKKVKRLFELLDRFNIPYGIEMGPGDSFWNATLIFPTEEAQCSS
jgi:hypothetical protein